MKSKRYRVVMMRTVVQSAELLMTAPNSEAACDAAERAAFRADWELAAWNPGEVEIQEVVEV